MKKSNSLSNDDYSTFGKLLILFHFGCRSYSRAAAGAEVRGGQAEIEEGMNGTAALRRSVGGGGGAAGGGTVEPAPVATLVVYKDEAGYGMKVSGDNPVYVQSVKEGVLLEF